jgi:hypothetical protein
MSENTLKPNSELMSESTALGFFYDRNSAGAHPIGCGFSVGEKLVIAPATSMLPYRSAPRMLRIHFPYANRNLCAEEIIFHPQFERAKIEHSIEQGLLLSSAEIVCADYNCCLVRLTDKAPALYESDLNDVQAALQFPLTPENNDLSGSLNDLDLSLVIQTLNSARKQGILYLFDEQGSPAAQIFCSDGKVISARFGPLTGTLAVYQILEKRTVVNFGFYPSARGTYWPSNLINSSTDMLLIEDSMRSSVLNNVSKSTIFPTSLNVRSAAICSQYRKNCKRLLCAFGKFWMDLCQSTNSGGWFSPTTFCSTKPSANCSPVIRLLKWPPIALCHCLLNQTRDLLLVC